MGYVAMGDVSSDNFNSTKYPGVCKPSNTATLAVFKAMQTQLNRCASVSGMSTIAIDGDVGPGTISLFGKLKAALMSIAPTVQFSAGVRLAAVDATSCSSIAAAADTIRDVAEAYANSKGAAVKPPAPTPTKPPVLVDSKTGIEKPAPAGANLLASFESLPTVYKVVGAGILAGIGFFAYKDMKKLGKRRRSRR